MKRFFLLGMLVIFLVGCQFQIDSSKKVKDLDFTVVENEKVPEKLAQALEEKKADPFKLTYQDQGNLYLCAGYGEQPTGGYSIAVEALYLTENAIYFDTTLMGPGKDEVLTETPSYPYIVVMTEDLDLPAVFQ
ncbi:MAG: protease complex subunit PrcB family protein [Lachnospiraceae bacterium]|nr:protease complex subunit PrcB family protein [Lachnospiraceae bacterium]